VDGEGTALPSDPPPPSQLESAMADTATRPHDSSALDGFTTQHAQLEHANQRQFGAPW